MIMKRAEAIGLDWGSAMAELKAQDWEARMKVRRARRADGVCVCVQVLVCM